MLLLSREKKMNKDVLRFFFRNGIAHLSILTPFVFRIVNRGVVIWINLDLVLVRQSKQMLFFTWEMYNPGLTRNMGEIIFSFRIFTPAGLLNIIKVCRDTPS